MTLLATAHRAASSGISAGGIALFVLILLALAGLAHHGRHYRRNRRSGFGIWYSMRGPFGTRETISKRF
jgi:hypothetical protein